MSELPEGWVRIPFTEVVKSLSTTGHVVEAKEYSLTASIPVLTQGSVDLDGMTDDMSRVFTSDKDLIVFGDHTRAIKLACPPFAVGPNTKVLEPGLALASKFLFYQLPLILPPSRGYGRHYQFLAKTHVVLAPIAEQERIVAAIEEQFSRLDAGVAALERMRQNLRRIRAAVMEAVVPSPGGQTTPKVPLGNLVASGRKIAYGVLVPGDHDPDGVPFVRVGDLSNRQVSTQGLKHIAPAIAARYPRTRLQGSEVLLSLVGTIGRTAVVPPELAGANTARALAVIPVQEAVEPRYVAIALSRDRVTRELTDLSHEVARKTLNLEDVRSYEIPLPTYSEQLEVVKAVETQETWIRSVEEVVARTFRRADHLRSSILQTAFSGRLVPQDESDEPASALFARIATGRTSANSHRLARSRKPRVPREEATA